MWKSADASTRLVASWRLGFIALKIGKIDICIVSKLHLTRMNKSLHWIGKLRWTDYSLFIDFNGFSGFIGFIGFIGFNGFNGFIGCIACIAFTGFIGIICLLVLLVFLMEEVIFRKTSGK